MMVRPLPSASTILKNPTFLLASFGVTNILIVASVDMTLPSHQYLRKISSKSSTSKVVLRDDNPSHHEFRVLMVPDRDDPEVEKQFVISFPPKYTARSPFGRAIRPMLAFDIEAGGVVFLRTIGGQMWAVWRRKAKFTRCLNLRAFQISHLLERETMSTII